MAKKYNSPEEAFAARTEWRDGCLVWVGALISNGYGQLRVAGVRTVAHRYAWERVYGKIPKGLHLDHKCFNKTCVNVRHLRLATPKQNAENQSGPPKSNTSGFLGVYWDGRAGKWFARIIHNGTPIHGGYYTAYELHVAGFRARELRNKLFTHNQADRLDNQA